MLHANLMARQFVASGSLNNISIPHAVPFGAAALVPQAATEPEVPGDYGPSFLSQFAAPGFSPLAGPSLEMYV